ncbi:hypothetical protein AOQ84DRAFT_115066 [Glonium stellatum]|uniref:Nudix hydrolase domain-containing protein n=1 Tax=Glonium stellatum TaxID=574774 RepID=A0A8E2JXY5_9PEZI|nr:hypothetical protein AOQ84DRAFT_115066 [Glonium stellatum]
MEDNLSIPQVLSAENFVISAGTVCFDVSKSMILLLYHRPKDEYLLPKGRVNAGERFSDAALRETLEESGVTATLLPSPIETLAPGLSPGELNTEPFVVSTAFRSGAWKFMFWYIAQADYSAPRSYGKQEAGEEFDTVWVPQARAPGVLSYPDDSDIATKALSIMAKRE